MLSGLMAKSINPEMCVIKRIEKEEKAKFENDEN
jgi:hypothetical protein